MLEERFQSITTKWGTKQDHSVSHKKATLGSWSKVALRPEEEQWTKMLILEVEEIQGVW